MSLPHAPSRALALLCQSAIKRSSPLPRTPAQASPGRTRFEAWRALVPYGCWTTRSGRQVLHNRDYRPIYQRYPNQPARLADPAEWVEDITNERWFFHDGTSPVSNWNRRREWEAPLIRVNAVLAEWGLPPLPPRPRFCRR